MPSSIVTGYKCAVNRRLTRTLPDRGHHVIDTGPYAIIRHPGYAFGFAFFLGIPLTLGSLWGLIPAMIMSAALGRADGPGGSDAPERVAGVQAIRRASPIPADSWGLVDLLATSPLLRGLDHNSTPASCLYADPILHN